MINLKLCRYLTFSLGMGLASASADSMGILIPAYFYPTTEAGNLWSQLNAAAGEVPVTAIMNPGNGPGLAVDPGYQAAVHALAETTYGHVVGYVHTRVSPGSLVLRDLAAVEIDIDRYVTWYGGSGLDGIFVDEMRNDPSSPAGEAYPGKAVGEYYQDLCAYIVNGHPGYRVIGNPGAAGGQIEAYLQSPRAADTLVTFENSSGYEAHVPPEWTTHYSSGNFAHIPYNVPSAVAMDYDVRLARAQNVGYIYVTDDIYTLGLLNPWDSLPSYWGQEVQLVKSINAGTLPPRLALIKAPQAPAQAASLFFSGNPGTYQLDASEDLVHWAPVHTTAAPSGGFLWADPDSLSLARRYYRIAP